MLNVEDNFSECSISISPNLGQLKSVIDTSPTFTRPNLANIKDALNHQIRLFLKTEGSGSLIAIGPPMLASNPIGFGSIMKKRELNELSNSIFKQKMKQTIMGLNSNENLIQLENPSLHHKKQNNTNFFNKRFLPSNQTSPNIFCGSGMFASSLMSLGSFSNEGGNNNDSSSKIKSRVEMIKSYQRISENELLLRSLDEVESLAMEIQEQGHTIGKKMGNY